MSQLPSVRLSPQRALPCSRLSSTLWNGIEKAAIPYNIEPPLIDGLLLPYNLIHQLLLYKPVFLIC